MYNGVGILTPRGSGTSGHVQGNKFNMRSGPPQRQTAQSLDAEGPVVKKANRGIIDHNRKREIELKIAQEQAKMEDEGLGPEEIEELVVILRQQEYAKFEEDNGAEAEASARLKASYYA